MYRLWNYGIFLWDFLTSLCETVDPPHIYIQYMVYFAFLFGCFEREWGGLVQRKSCKHMKRRESKKKMGLGFSFSLFTVPHFLTIIWKNILNKHFLSCFDEKLQGKENEAMTIDSSKILRICVPRVMNTVVGNSVSLQCNVYWDMGWDYIEFLLLGSKFCFCLVHFSLCSVSSFSTFSFVGSSCVWAESLRWVSIAPLIFSLFFLLANFYMI